MVSPWAVAAVVFVSVFGGALFGMFLRGRLSEHHLSPETKDLVKLGVGLIGTMSALVLGLLVASAKGSYDTQRSELIQMSAKIVVAQRSLQAQALSITMDVGQTRWLMFQQTDSSISAPLLVVVVLWLTIIFISFGLFAHPMAWRSVSCSSVRSPCPRRSS